jgi:hypothetical protein
MTQKNLIKYVLASNVEFFQWNAFVQCLGRKYIPAFIKCDRENEEQLISVTQIASTSQTGPLIKIWKYRHM